MNSLGRYSGYAYAIMRIVVGLLFACHGAQKLFAMFGGKGGATGMVLVGGIIELVGGFLIALGLLTRPAAFLSSGMMAVAYFGWHAGGGFFPIVNKGELAVVYCFVFLYMFFRGSGPLALDNLIFKDKTGTNDLGATVAARRSFEDHAMGFPGLVRITAVALALFVAPGLVAQDWAKARLNDSPRHGEFVEFKSGDRTLRAFVVYPEKKDKTPVVLVIHEIFGLTDWVRGVCDQLAEQGVIAIAPDMLSGQTFPDVDGARKAISALPKEQVIADLNATAEYAAKIPASNGTLAVTGFCWGGGWAFGYATQNPKLKAAYPFYGPVQIEPADIAKIGCPVYGFYAENDERVNATIPKAEEMMKTAGKKFEPVFYKGAGHGFMRDGENPEGKPENKQAREEAWARWKTLLKQL